MTRKEPIGVFLGWICTIICSPCLLPFWIFNYICKQYCDWKKRIKERMEKRKQDRRTDVERNAIWAAELSSRRKADRGAHLLPGNRHDLAIEEFASISMQSHSTFFSKLPVEIRQLIYGFALGGERLRLQASGVKHDQKHRHQLICPSGSKLMGLPKSCKLAYLESIHCVYALNTFQFSDMTAFVCFQQTLPLQYFHQIQAMHLKWLCPPMIAVYGALLHSRNANHLSYWDQIWTDIPNMKALKNLRVDLTANFLPYPFKVQEEKMLFSPIENAYREGFRDLYVFVDPLQDRIYPRSMATLERQWSFPLRTPALEYWSQRDEPQGEAFSWVNELEDLNMPDCLM